MLRRTFAATGLLSNAMMMANSVPRLRLGLDLFSVRSQNWTAFQSLDYAAKLGIKVVHFSEIRFLGGLEDAHLKAVRARAQEHGIEIEAGMRSICPTSTSFDPKQGSAEEQLTHMIHAAVVLGSPIVRAFLGSSADRNNPEQPLEAHIDNTVRVLRAVRSRTMDAGIKIAIENHSGDLQARELKTLIEEAGKDFVGAVIDAGNPLWAIEDPHLTLETLAPYVLTSHVRDSAVWRTENGAAVRWVRMGEGNVGIADWVRKYGEMCPGKALSMEIIVTGARLFPYLRPEFWNAYRQTPAWEFARFAAIADKGKTFPDPPRLPKDAAVERERADLEASIQFTKSLL